MGGAQCSERVQDRGKGLERSRRGGQEPLRIPIAAAFSPSRSAGRAAAVAWRLRRRVARGRARVSKDARPRGHGRRAWA